MPKTLQGVNNNAYTGKAQVPATGDDREASNIEVPVQVLLDDAAYLLAKLKDVIGLLETHGHDPASADAAGFMSPTEKAAIYGFGDALASHRHGNATPESDGFFSKGDKIRLNGIEDKAQVVTKTRVVTALGLLYGQITIPESSFSAGQTKGYEKAHEGVKYDAPITASETLKSDAFLMSYHVENNQVSVKIRNLNSSSKTFPGGTVRYKVDNSGAA